MAPAFAPRGIPWLAGAGLLAGILAFALGAGWALGARAWWLYLGLALFALLLLGAVERLWQRRSPPRAPRARGRLKVIPGGKSDYDLEKDDPSRKQRWLM